jgi:hypothetical protein
VEIRFSRYNQPFTEPSTADVHYISLDDQHAIRAGLFDAHVQLFRSRCFVRPSRSFRSFSTNSAFEIFNPLTGSTHVYDLTGLTPFAPSVEPLVVPDAHFVDSLRKSGVRSAARVNRCTCGNSRKPWRCTCDK